jgi:hypothetical protein
MSSNKSSPIFRALVRVGRCFRPPAFELATHVLALTPTGKFQELFGIKADVHLGHTTRSEPQVPEMLLGICLALFLALSSGKPSAETPQLLSSFAVAFVPPLTRVPGHGASTSQTPAYTLRGTVFDSLANKPEFFATAIIVGPDLDSENLRFALRRTASLSGQIFDEMSEPVRNAQVLLFRQALNFGRRETSQEQEGSTDDPGHYHFGHLAAGTYFVGVVAQPWYARHPVRQATESVDAAAGETLSNHAPYNAPALDVVYPLMFFPNAADLSSAAPITLHPGDAESADMTLRPIPAVHLLIRLPSSDESEQPFVQQVTQQIASGIEQGLPAQNISNCSRGF